MEWLLIVAVLWVLGLFMPLGTLRERLEPTSIPAVILSGVGVLAVLTGIAGVVWFLLAVILGVWNGIPA